MLLLSLLWKNKLPQCYNMSYYIRQINDELCYVTYFAIMATKLEKIYSIIDNSKDLELELTEELVRKINETEESIIREASFRSKSGCSQIKTHLYLLLSGTYAEKRAVS